MSARRTTDPGRLLVLALAALTAACGDGVAGPSTFEPVDLAAPWQEADPADVGVDAGALQQAVAEAEALPRMRSLLVVRSGRLILERYFHGFQRDSLADVRSVTKSVVSTLTGIALDRGELPSLDTPIGDVLPESVAVLTEAQKAITFRHLLTMSGGFSWDESAGVGMYTTGSRPGTTSASSSTSPSAPSPAAPSSTTRRPSTCWGWRWRRRWAARCPSTPTSTSSAPWASASADGKACRGTA